MKKRRIATAYAILCTLLMVAGIVLAFFFSWKGGTTPIIDCICGVAVSFIFAPTLHESGHILFGQNMGMQLVYTKIFCFQIIARKGKLRLSFASPFAAEQTQMLPKKGGDMRRRATWYTLGGLLVGGILLSGWLLGAVICTCVGKTNYFLWGSVPYTAYLFFLNALPFEYASGKTDALVLRGICKGYDAEKCMLAAMEIQGQLYAGNTFAEIDETLYFDLPQLSEEEPLFAVLLDLRYRYYLDKENFDGAADCLNRLASSQAYLAQGEVEKLAAELTYMHAIGGDLERAEESSKLCRGFLQSDEPSAKRVLAAYAMACGKQEEGEVLLEQARDALAHERIAGLKKFEEKLLAKIKK